MKNSYEHLFFDLDHTLWDFDANSRITLHTLYKEFALQEIGIEDVEEFCRVFEFHNDRLWTRLRNGFIKRNDLRWKRIWYTLLDFKVGDTALAYAMSDRYLQILPTQTLLIPHALDILDYCTEKEYKIYLITNGYEQTQFEKLKSSAIEHYFQKMITSEVCQNMKPHKEIFDYALEVTGAQIENSIMIGDNWDADILGAQNAGWAQIYFNPKLPKTETFNSTYAIDCLSKLKEIL